MVGGGQTIDELSQTQLPVCIFIRQLYQSIDTQRPERQSMGEVTLRRHYSVTLSILTANIGMTEVPYYQVSLQSV